MHDAVEAFVEHLRHSRFTSVADQMEQALRATDAEADGNPSAAAMWEGVIWICAHDNRSLTERVLALCRLVEHDGSLISMQAFTGWMEIE